MYGYCPGWDVGGVSLSCIGSWWLVIRILRLSHPGSSSLVDIQALEEVGVSAVIGEGFL
ncbi:MAG: hypothetical protein ACLUDU_05650 [Butyricimonas faecihominis]